MPGGGIGRGAPPVRAAPRARELDVVRLSLDGVKSPSLAASRTACFSAACSSARHERVDVVRLERLPGEGGRFGRERLRRRRHFAGNLALRDRALFDRPQRLAGQALEHVEESGLARLRDDVDASPLVSDGEELRRGGEVVVPEIVVHSLEVPLPRAGAGVEGDEASCRTGCRRRDRRRRNRGWGSRAARRRARACASMVISPQLLTPPAYSWASAARSRSRIHRGGARCGRSTPVCRSARRRRGCRRGASRSLRPSASRR